MADGDWRKAVGKRAEKAPFFDSSAVQQSNAYVAWVDALGTKSALLVSHARAANFVMRIHAAALDANPPTDLSLFPMNDGVFIRADTWDPLRKFLERMFRRLAVTFLLEQNPQHRFMVRGAVAFGPLSSGSQLHGGNSTLTGAPDHSAGIILGMPLAQAVEAERLAPPFGVFIHESARAFAPSGDKPLCYALWRWWGDKDSDIEAGMREALPEYFAWARRNPLTSQYPAPAVDKHALAASEYFGIP